MLEPSQLGKVIATTHAQDQKGSIPYRPQYTLITGKVAASILLQQISYWWHIKNGKPFYKFRSPCDHDWYKDGDSWTEELGMTPGGFDTALKAIGAKVTKGSSKSELLKTNLVIYWTDASRVTWYQLNENLFYETVYLAYNEPQLLGNSGFRNQLDKHGNVIYLYSETTPKTTTTHVADATPALADEKQKCPRCKNVRILADGFCGECLSIVDSPLGAPADAEEQKQQQAAALSLPLNPFCDRCSKSAALNNDGLCDECAMVDRFETSRPGICPDCHKHKRTTAKMPYKNQTCTCQAERVLADAFGDPPEPGPTVEAAVTPHWTKQAAQPWATWGAESDEFQRQLQRFGDSGRIVQELGYKLERATNLKPLWSMPKKVKSWSSGLWELYQEAGCNIAVAIEAAKALRADKKMTPANPYSFVNVARALAADRSQPAKRIVIK